MTEEQRRIASEAIASVVRDAIESTEQVTGDELKKRAKEAAEAIAAGFAALNVSAVA